MATQQYSIRNQRMTFVSENQSFLPKRISLRVPPRFPVPVKLEDQQALREIIVDYIIHRGNSKKTIKFATRFVELRLSVNDQSDKQTVDICRLVDKYLQCESISAYPQKSIKLLSQEIVEMIQRISEMHIQFPSNEDYASQLNETVMQIVMNYHKNKQKDAFRNDFDTFTEFSKSKIRRTKDKVHFQEQLNIKISEASADEDINFNRISRTTVEHLEREEKARKHQDIAHKSKLRRLLDTCNIFDHPQRLEKLKREKTIENLSSGESEYEALKENCKEVFELKPSEKFDIECLKVIQDWVWELSLTEKLVNKKYQKQSQRASKEEKSRK